MIERVTMTNQTLPPFSGGFFRGVELNERLHRECDRCDYQWDEAIARD